MKIIPLSKLNPMVESRRWLIFTKKTQEKSLIVILYGAYLPDFLLDVLKLDMKFILLFKPNSMVEYAGYVTISHCFGWSVCQSVPN